jgi:hypothetical protein
VVALIGVLIALAFPTIARVRSVAWDVKSIANVRTHAQSVAAYAIDWDDSFVHFTRPGADATIVGACGFRAGYRYFENSAFWYLPIAELEYGSCWSETLFLPGGYDEAIAENRMPWDYFLTPTAITEPGYWNLETRTGREQWGTRRLDHVRFPSAKATITELAWFPTLNGDRDTPFIGLGLADGSASRFARKELAPPIATGEGRFHDQWIFVDGRYGLHTPDGLLGRDIE